MEREMGPDVGINGAGRIGRLTLRELASLSRSGQPKVTKINDPEMTPEQLAYLVWSDSVHGRFRGEISHGTDRITVNGREIEITRQKNPAKLDWKGATVIESSGHFRDGNLARRHIMEGGAERVIISAPAKEVDGTFVMGVNHRDYDPERHKVISMASCTTNAITPIIKVLEERFGINSLVFNTIHAYTGDQPSVDSGHKDINRARAAMLNLVPTSTGASQAVKEVLPDLNARLHGVATRVPVADGSLLDITARLKTSTQDPEEIRNTLRKAAKGLMGGILEVSDMARTSSDIVGNTHSSVVLAHPIEEIDDGTYRFWAGYDNERAYATRLAQTARGSDRSALGLVV